MGLELAQADRIAGPRCCAVRGLHRGRTARAGSVDQPVAFPKSGLRLDHRRRHYRQHRLHRDGAEYDDLPTRRSGTKPDRCRLGVPRTVGGRVAGWQPVPVLISASLLLGGASLLATSAASVWSAYLPLLGLTGVALGLGWTLPSIGSQTVVDPARAGEAAGVNLTVMVTIAGVAVALAGTLIELWAGGTADIVGATRGVLRLVSVISMVGGAGL